MVKISFRPNPDYKYMYDDCVYQLKEQNKSLNQFKGKKIELGQYRNTRPIQKNSANTSRIGWVFSVLAEFFDIGRVCNRYDAGLIWPYRYYINVVN